MIETKRLYLRELTMEDIPSLFKVLGDAENMKYSPYTFDMPLVEKQIKRNLERYRVLGFGLWAVCLKETGELIGDCGLTMQLIDEFICPEIGYHVRRDLQKRGYASEASRAVRDWAFTHTPFKTIYSYMKYTNISSRQTALKWGAHFEKEYVDEINEKTAVYSMSKDEWERRQEKKKKDAIKCIFYFDQSIYTILLIV